MIPYTVAIPANGVATFQGSGKYFLLTALTGAIRVLTNHNEEYDFSESNSGFGNDLSQPFGKLTFYDSSGVANSITFYVSDSPIKTSDVNVTSSVSVTANMSSPLSTSAEIVPGQFLKTNTIGAGPVRLANAGTYATRVTVIARKTLNPTDDGGTANAGNVMLGVSATAHQQPIELAPGDVWEFSVDSGRKLDMGKIYLAVLNDNDGVVVLYY